MKRRYLQLVVAILILISISSAVFIGCSAAYRGTDARMQTTDQSPRYSADSLITKTADPAPRRIIEGQPSEELWIIGPQGLKLEDLHNIREIRKRLPEPPKT